MRQLIDLSSANGLDHDLYAASAAGVSGAILRTGEGLQGRDPSYGALVAKVEQQGWRHASYHLMAPSSGDPAGQAKAMYDLAGKPSPVGGPPPFIDVERNTPLTNAEAQSWARFLVNMCSAADDLFQRQVGWYTYSGFLASLRPWLPYSVLARPRWLAKYPALAATSPVAASFRSAYLAARTEAYKPTAGQAERVAMVRAASALVATKDNPTPTGTMPDCTMWQWGGDANGATCPGVSTLCDRTLFAGDDAAWDAFCGVPTIGSAPAAVAGETAG